MESISFTTSPEVALFNSMGDDEAIVNAAKVSVRGDLISEIDPESASSFIDFLMRNRHGSPFEHTSMTFRIKAPIFVWREFMRHRVGFSYNEESARYRELNPEFYIPSRARYQEGKPGHYDITHAKEGDPVSEEMKAIMEVASAQAYKHYQGLLSEGVAREVARMVLPLNIMSSAYVTCNARSLMNFLSLRVHDETAVYPSYPQYEIEQVANVIESYLSEAFPLTYDAYVRRGRVSP
jgi:thymidylate synthase (FAD)